MNDITTNSRMSPCHSLRFRLLFLALSWSITSSATSFCSQYLQQFQDQIANQMTILHAVEKKGKPAPAVHPFTTTFNPPPCPGGSGVIGGTTFQDFNLNGNNDQVGVVSGIQVDIFRCDADGNSELVSTTFSESDGSYSFSGLTDDQNYRLEFRIPTALSFLTPGSGAGNSGTNVQFVTSPSCEADAGFLNRADYCQEDPLIAAACYVNGDPLAPNSGSADEEAIVAFRYNASGNDEKIPLAKAKDVGSVYGMAYQKSIQRIFTSAFIKRHVGLGPLGTGGVYQVDYSTGTPIVSPFVDVATIGINVGNFPTNTERALSANPAIPNNDPQAYDAVGKWGVGGIALSDDEQTLWLVNLAEQSLHSIQVDADNNPATAPTAGDVATFPLPTAGCVGGDFRPFAVNYHQNAVYVGGVCDAALSQQETDLEAIIYRLEGNTFAEVARFRLDYDKGYTTFTNSCEDFPGWYPWRADLPPACSTNEIFRVYPTPMLTDMVFDVDNSLILGLTDRMGHQIGFKNYPLEGTQPLLQTISGGDIIRLFFNSETGEYELENNGTAGPNTTAGAGNGQGPGGGEFYYRDVFEGPIDNLVDPQPHTETAQGGLAFVPGSGEVVTTALDPYSTQFNAGGVNWLNNTTGENRNPGFLLYRSSNSNISTFSKANGLGDIISMCDLAPIEIGSYVWKDENDNGVQDPCEPPIVGVNVSIFSEDGTWLATQQTDETGQFFFNQTTEGLEDGLQPNTTYFVVVGTNGDFNVASGMLMDEGFIAEADQGVGPEPEVNDSDGEPATADIADGAFTGLPFVEITTGGPGFVEHNMDFGFGTEGPEPVTITGTTFIDEDEDGIQDDNETGFPNVTVTLYDADGNVVGTTTTDDNGDYTFTVTMGGDYYIVFDTDPTLGDDDYMLTDQDRGDDTIDSDADPNTGQTATFTVNITDGTPIENVDAGYIRNENTDATIGDFVFLDCNNNGIQDDGEVGVPKVNVTLISLADNSEMTTVTDANGIYSFINLAAGDYQVRFTLPAAGLVFSPADQGNDDIDSDVNPNGITGTISLAESEQNNSIDAGIVDNTAPMFNDSLPNANLIFDCTTGTVPNPVNLTAGDNFDQNVEVFFAESSDGGSGGCANGSLVRTWTATDVCGNMAFFTQTITFNDDQAPTFNEALPQDETGICYTGDFGTAPTLTASDNCDNDVEVVLTEEAVGGGCNDTRLTRTWTATDDCGNSISHQQTITYSDLEHPIFNQPLPQNMTVDCLDGGIGEAPTVTATDNCDNDVEVTLEILNVGSNCADAQIIRVWTATDDCGNFIKHEQTISFSDTEAPTFNESLPQDETGVCFTGDFSTAPTLTASDNCDNNIEVILTETAVGGGCNDTRLTRTWTATDACGNSVSHQQTITYSDTEDPTFNGNLPQDMTITDCSAGGVPIAPTLTASDNCDNDVTVTFTEENDTSGSACVNNIIVRTWVAMDECGNNVTHQQIITFNDVNAPTFNESLPQNQTGICFTGDFGTAPTLTASDDCDNDVEVILTEEAVGGGCNDTRLTRTWTATDDCGNSISHQQVITFSDSENPTFNQTLPQDMTTEDCGGNVGQAPTLTASDNCDNDVEVTFTETVIGGGCAGGGIQRTWVATDDCGNSISHQQTITFIDNTNPTFTSPLPQDINAGQACGVADISNPPTLLAADNCDDDVTVTFAQNFVDGNNDGCAGGILLRVWTAADDCGNSISHEQRIMFGDNQAPRFVGVLPPNMSGAECADVSVDNPPVLTATDDCDINVEVVFTQEITEGDISSCAGGTLVRTWTATDDCGNSVTHNQVISFSDNTAPMIVGVPDDVTVECDDIPGVPIVKGVDDCGGEVTLDFQETQTTGCPYTITRTWKATDECGNMDTAVQVITVTDTLPPLVFYNNPFLINLQNEDTLYVDCDRVPVLGDQDVRVIDNCDANPEIEFVDFIVNEADCAENGYLAYMYCGWIVTDDCGNTATLNIHIIVEDNTAPTLTGVPADITIGAGGSLPDIPTVTATDNCDIDVSVQFTQTIVNTDCGYFIRRTWTAKDDCGNIAVGTQIITVNNNCACPVPIVNNRQINDADCGQNNGSATFFINGNPADFVIDWTPNVGTPNADNTSRSNLPPGFYNIKITYPLATDCVFDHTFEIKGEQPSNPNVDVTNINCPGGSNGSITARDNRTYNVSLNGSVIGQTPISALAAGTYQVSIGNQTGCTASTSVTITQPDAINVAIDKQNVSCDGNDGAISLTVTGGNGGYTYDWTPLITTNSFATGLAIGTYQIRVADSKGCSQMVTIDITEDCNIECDLTLTGTSVDASCAGNDGSISVTVGGNSNSGNISYNWQPNVSMGSTANNLAAGTYTITAIDNASQCTASTTVTIGQGTTPAAPEVSTINLKCAGECTGQILPADQRMYTISQNGTPVGIAPATNLCAGTYTVSYTDDNNCSNSIEVQLTEPEPFVASVTIVGDTCGRGTGMIIINATGGTEPYNFLVNGVMAESNIITNLTAGDYSIWLMDANSCGNEPGNQVVPLIEEDCETEVECNLVLSPLTFPETCIGNNGSIVINVSGSNSGNLTYTWSPDLGNGSSINTLEAGTYKVSVTDNETGCMANIDVVVESDATTPADPLVNTVDADCAFTCTGGISSQDGRAYEIFDNGNLIGNTPKNDLCEGIYEVVYTEGDCRSSIEVTINEPSQLIASATTVATDCEENNGVISIAAMGGTPPYTYTINGEIANSNTINGLAAGTYNLVVTDSKGCTTEGLVATVEQSECETICNLSATTTVINASCGEENGSITVNVSNAVGTIVYDWNPDITDAATAENLAAGTYQITVRDEMTGCVAIAMATIENDGETPAAPQVFMNNPTCHDANDGQIAATDNRGYFVMQNDQMVGQTPLNNLGQGTYEVRFTTAEGCFSTTMVTLVAPTPIIALANTTDDNCDGGAGSISLTVGGGTGSYSYQWSNEISTSNNATGLDAGTYGVTVTDANGCTAELSNIVVGKDCTVVPCSLEGRATISPAVCGQMNGRIALEITGAVGALTYTWTPLVSETAVAENLEPGMYNIMVMDAGASCELEFNIEVKEAPLPNGPNVRISFPLCVDEDNNTATVMSNDDRTFQVFDGNNLLGSTPLEGVAEGTYTVVYEDENGCSTSLDIHVDLPEEIEVQVATTNETCAENDGSITLTATGGIGSADDYTYQWFPSIPSATNVAENLMAGTYDVIVRDSIGCSKIINDIDIIKDCPCNIGLQIADKNDASCAGNDGNITLEVTGNISNDITVSWNNNIPNGLIASNLATGTYEATLTDNTNGCTANIAVVVGGSEAVEAPQLNLTHVGCAGGNDGMILSADGRTYVVYDAVTEEFQASPMNLTAGSYRVVYTNINGCSTEMIVSLTQPEALSISATAVNAVGCAGGDGSIQLNVTGGEPDYIYEWSDASISGNFANNLAVGSYSLTVTDGNGCQIFETYEVTEDCNCDLNINVLSAKMATCEQANGSIDIEVNGTTYGDLRYNWSGDVSNNSSATGLAAGIYTVEVTDAISGCSATQQITIDAMGAPTAPMVDVRGITCGGDSDGAIIATDDRNYEVFKDGQFIGTTPLNNLGTGIYTILSTNDTECTSQFIAEIEPLTAIESHVEAFPAGCNGNDGMVRLQIDGGVAPYTYEWSDNVSTSKQADGLMPDMYSIVVTDARGCQVRLSAIVGRVCNIPVDTVRISIAANETTEYCIPERFLQPTGTLTSGHILTAGNTSSVVATSFTGRCVTFAPAADFTGESPDQIEVISCYDSSTDICDKTVFIISVDCPNELIAGNEFSVSGLTGIQCLNIDPATLAGYDVYINGELQSNSRSDCMYKPLAVYNYDGLDVDGSTYQVTWRVNGQPHEGTASSLFEVADLLNQWDVVANWSNNADQNQLMGGTAPFNYGTLLITHSSGAPTLLDHELTSQQIGTTVDLGAGADFITIENAEGCTQTINLTTEQLVGGFRFIDFTASANAKSNAVPMQWKTFQEEELARFYIEHSTDSLKFKTLDHLVMGKGINDGINEYNWTHTQPRWGYNYYRIRYVNDKGETIRTFTLRVFIQPDNAPDVYIYPNPTVKNVTVDFLQPLETIGTLQLVNGFGQILETIQVEAGEIRHTLSFDKYPSGMYFIQIDWNDFRKESYRIIRAE